MEKINITVIGGGAGTFNVLYGLKNLKLDNPEYNLAAIVTMTDSGGTAGEIRDKYGILPPGDVRRAIAALANDTKMVRQLFEYRFANETGVIGGNKIGNILITALTDIEGSFESALYELGKMFGAKGKVIPVTLEDVHLGAEFDDGTVVIGEKEIDVSDKNSEAKGHNIDQNISKAFLVGGEGVLNPKAKDVLLNSDIIIIGPGSLYTSLVPCLLSKGMKEALAEAKGKKIFINGIMADKGETTYYELPDFIENIEKYAGEIFDYVIVNNGDISEELVEKYKEEGKRPIKLQEGMDFSNKKFRLIQTDLINESDYVRHDPTKVAKIIDDIAHGWIK